MTPCYREALVELTFKEQYRLIEIAHETREPELRRLAIAVLREYRSPLTTFRREDSSDLLPQVRVAG